MAQKKIYVVTKNGEQFTEFGYRTVEGFSFVRETVKELKDKKPQYNWDSEVYNPSKHI